MVQELERNASFEIAALRTITSSPAISREIWFCSPTYAWRFFRIGDHALTEIGRDASRSRGRHPSRDPALHLRPQQGS